MKIKSIFHITSQNKGLKLNCQQLFQNPLFRTQTISTNGFKQSSFQIKKKPEKAGKIVLFSFLINFFKRINHGNLQPFVGDNGNLLIQLLAIKSMINFW
jgi:hypothetical protein